MNANANKKTVSIHSARTATETFEKARNTRLKKAVAAAKQGIDVGPSRMGYPNNSMTPAERSAAVKAAMAAAPFAIGPYKVTNVPVAAIAVDLYQRGSDEDEERLTNENFDYAKMDILKTSYRDGILYAIDGSHRVKKAVELGIEYLPVIILEGLTREEEARYFKTQDDQKVPLKPAQKFRAGIVAKEQTASIIYALCDSFGLTVTNKTRGTKAPMKAIVAATNIVNNETIDGADCFCWMLSLMNEAKWFEDRKLLLGALTSHVLHGFEGVYIDGMREKNLDQYTARLLKELRKLSPEFITCYGKLQNPQMDRRGYTKVVLKDIAKGVINAEEIKRLAREAHLLASGTIA